MTGAEILLRVNSDNPPTLAEILGWLRSASKRGAAGRDMLTALGLTRVELVKARDAAMREAAHGLGADGCDTWVLANRLSKQIARFESRVWPRLCAGLPVEGLSPVDVALQRVFEARVRVIKSQGKVYAWLLLQNFHTAQTDKSGK